MMRRAVGHPVAALALAPARNGSVDALRGFAVLWMTVFHFAFDLNHFGFIHQDFYTSPLWTTQRTCILSLFLFCAGLGQSLAVASGQTWGKFWRRWVQIAGCAALVSIGSVFMFPQSWIYFGVLHGMAVMLLISRLTGRWRQWLWLAGAVAIGVGLLAQPAHAMFPQLVVLNQKVLSWIGFVSQKPITEDFVPVLPWLGVLWWGMAAGQLAIARGWLTMARPNRSGAALRALAFIGRWSLTWYMVHQPLLIGLLTLTAAALHQ